jgi:redox-sensitive bicupin YhaK (pirin superfamily)
MNDGGDGSTDGRTDGHIDGHTDGHTDGQAESAREPAGPAVESVIVARSAELGDGFEVRRALPAAGRRMVGPFIFLDQMGPTVLRDGQGLDVRPHPHIGLATLTYLFDGQLLHRDSLGFVQPIRPGEANWMIAGRGIVHSERTPPADRRAGERLFGLQCWLALPLAHEEDAPSFAHVGADELPVIEGEGVRARLIAGALFGARAPEKAPWPMLYADLQLSAGARLEVPPLHEERALYVAAGSVVVEGQGFGVGSLVILRAGADVVVSAPEAARAMLLGGATMDGPRHIYWNFVSSSRERIEAAKADWREERFASVPGETERIPLPPDRRPPPPVEYP